MSETGLHFDPQLSADAQGMTVNNFHKASKGGSSELLLRPAFQRNLVWNRDQKSYLVDSILRGLPVPELYLQIATAADGTEKLTVVDGQQRISTCVAFANGDLKLSDSEDLDPEWRGKFFSELNEKLRARFLSFKFVVRDLPTSADDSVLREIFRRLNRTVEALEAQELRHAAYTGPFILLVERGGSAAALNDLGVFTPKDYLRRRNDEFIAEVLMAIDAGAFPNKKEGLNQLFLTFERQGVPSDRLSSLTRKFGRAISIIEAKSSILKRTRFRNKSDCYSLLVFLAHHADHLNVDDPHVDVMVNTLVEFSSQVNRIKREESRSDTDDPLAKEVQDPHARSYLRAVERAASDRLNRVRRNAALEAILGAQISSLPIKPLSHADESWRLAGEDLEEAEEENDESADRRSAQEALLDDEIL